MKCQINICNPTTNEIVGTVAIEFEKDDDIFEAAHQAIKSNQKFKGCYWTLKSSII